MAVRDKLVHLLTEAAEIEHNLLCSYLYAAFSLKRGPGDRLADKEAAAVRRWRKTVLGVAIEEMSHLALVNNLLVALGGAPHFDRPNLPVPPGYHPAGLRHQAGAVHQGHPGAFHFPRTAGRRGGAGRCGPLRRACADRAPDEPSARSVRRTPDYDTIGEFYGEIRSSLIEFADTVGPHGFLAQPERQLSPLLTNLPGLLPYDGSADAG